MIYSIVCQEDYENFISSYLSAPPTPKKEKAKQEPHDSHLAYIPDIFTQSSKNPAAILIPEQPLHQYPHPPHQDLPPESAPGHSAEP